MNIEIMGKLYNDYDSEKKMYQNYIYLILFYNL